MIRQVESSCELLLSVTFRQGDLIWFEIEGYSYEREKLSRLGRG